MRAISLIFTAVLILWPAMASARDSAEPVEHQVHETNVSEPPDTAPSDRGGADSSERQDATDSGRESGDHGEKEAGDASALSEDGNQDSGAIGETQSESTTPVRGPLEVVRDSIGSEHSAQDIVVLASSAEANEMRRRGLGIVAEDPLSQIGGVLLTVQVAPGKTAQDVLAALRTASPAAISDLDHIYRLAEGTAGDLRPRDKAPTSELVQASVGVVDASVDADYPSVRNSLLATRSFASGESADDFHGTAVAEILSLQGVHVLAANVFCSDTQGNPAATTASIIRAMNWLMTQNVTVINLSLSGPRNEALAEAVRRAEALGFILVAAAGNDGPAAPPAFPAAYAGVVAVTAVDFAGNVYRYANHGPYISFAARGVDIDAPAPPKSRKLVSGTSYATPVVSAIIARAVKRRRSIEDSNFVVRQFETQAIDLGAPGRDPVYGFGLLDLTVKHN